jgi:hypothetical protein
MAGLVVVASFIYAGACACALPLIAAGSVCMALPKLCPPDGKMIGISLLSIAILPVLYILIVTIPLLYLKCFGGFSEGKIDDDLTVEIKDLREQMLADETILEKSGKDNK